MSFLPEVSVAMMKKLGLVELLRPDEARSEFAELRFEKSLGNSMEI